MKIYTEEQVLKIIQETIDLCSDEAFEKGNESEDWGITAEEVLKNYTDE